MSHAMSQATSQDRVTFNRQLSPRPLGLHLWLAATASASCLSGLTALKSGWPGWNSPEAAALRAQTEAFDTARLSTEIQRLSAADFGQFLTGVAKYRAHPFRRDASDVTAAAVFGSTRLLDFGASAAASGETPPPVLLVPSMVNRGYILDLLPDVSLARYLAAAGIRTFLLEWDAPSADEAAFDFSIILQQRMLPALDVVEEAAGPPALVGYCMGGLLALMVAARAEDRLAGLGLLATPWDFHAERPEQARAMTALTKTWFPALESLGQFPVDALQALFAANDPLVAFRKFQAFADPAMTPEDAKRFVALEDWLNDGIALPLPVARQAINGWYGDNLTGKGQWAVDGMPIRPETLQLPTLAVIPDQDRIVPQASAMALARIMPEAEIRVARAGHIGMMAGRKAERETWRPLASWVRTLPSI